MPATALLIDVEGVLARGSGTRSPQLCQNVAPVLERLRLAGVPRLALRQVVSDDGDEAAADAALLAAVQAAGAELSGVIHVGQDQARRFPKPGALLTAVQVHGIDLASSWLVSRRPEASAAAGTAGLQGLVFVGCGTELPPRLGLVIARAADLADAPRVMIPPQGGCWHDHASR